MTKCECYTLAARQPQLTLKNKNKLVVKDTKKNEFGVVCESQLLTFGSYGESFKISDSYD